MGRLAVPSCHYRQQHPPLERGQAWDFEHVLHKAEPDGSSRCLPLQLSMVTQAGLSLLLLLAQQLGLCPPSVGMRLQLRGCKSLRRWNCSASCW